MCDHERATVIAKEIHLCGWHNTIRADIENLAACYLAAEARTEKEKERAEMYADDLHIAAEGAGDNHERAERLADALLRLQRATTSAANPACFLAIATDILNITLADAPDEEGGG